MDHSFEPGRTSHPWTGFLICAFVLPLLYAYASVPPESGEPAGVVAAQPRGASPTRFAPDRVVGPQECSECHERETLVWKDTSHHVGSEMLTRSDSAKAIARALGVRRMKTDERCATCHFTLQEQTDKKRVRSVAGVSCESCHGSGRDWLEVHADFGAGRQDASEETPEHRRARLAASDAAGMLRPEHAFDMAASCHRCHTITDAELIEVGGHPAGDGFEFVAWSQGDVRHNFVRGEDNPTSARERQRVMYVVGRLAALVTAMRAEAAPQVAREREALEAVHAACADARLGRVLELSRELGSEPADRAASIAREFQREVHGRDLAAIDAMLPRPSEYR